MAYISKEDVKTIRNGIKATFKKPFKFSVVRDNSSEVVVSLMKGTTEHGDLKHYQINDKWPQKYEGDTRKLIETVNKIIASVKESYDRNEGDMGADYPNMTFFKSINLGKWDKEYEKVEGVADWNKIESNYKQWRIIRKLKEGTDE
jgi:hypothetical protein